MIDPDDFDSFDICPDCKGSGHVVTFSWDDPCPRCEGAGWLAKGTGWNRLQWLAWETKKNAPPPWAP